MWNQGHCRARGCDCEVEAVERSDKNLQKRRRTSFVPYLYSATPGNIRQTFDRSQVKRPPGLVVKSQGQRTSLFSKVFVN